MNAGVFAGIDGLAGDLDRGNGWDIAADGCGFEDVVGPFDVDFVAAACAQAENDAGGPCGGKGWEEIDGAGVRRGYGVGVASVVAAWREGGSGLDGLGLEQKLGEACGRRIVHGGEAGAEGSEGFVALEQACVERSFIGVVAAGLTQVFGDAGGGEEVGLGGGDLVELGDRDEVGGVAVGGPQTL